MYTFIVNPNSQGGNGKKIWNNIKQELDNKEIIYDVHFTKYPKHATEIANNVTLEKDNKTIVILGGDGTVNEVINGLNYTDNLTIGYIPAGSGNDYARGFDLPLNPVEALEIILNPKRQTLKIDQGQLSISEDLVHRFASNGGIGFDAEVSKVCTGSKLKDFLNKFKMGKLVYVIYLVQQIFIYKPVNAKITIDDEVHNYDNLLFACFTTHHSVGGGMKMCPGANPTDQITDICIANNLSKIQILMLFPTIFSGKHINIDGVKVVRGKNIKIETDRRVEVHTDGEVLGSHDSINVNTTEKQVELIVA